MKNVIHLSLSFITAVTLCACTTVPQNKKSIERSYLHNNDQEQVSSQLKQVGNNTDFRHQESLLDNRQTTTKPLNGMAYIPSLVVDEIKKSVKVDLTQVFSNTQLVELTADDLPLKDYLHYVLGELLGVSYILGEQVKADNKAVTLNLQTSISQQKLFNITVQLLTQRSYAIRLEEGIYYIHKAESTGSTGNIAYGYGQNVENVPETQSTIVQLVPFTFGMQASLATTLKKIVSIKITSDSRRNAMILEGKRKDIIKALEFIQLMDQPVFQNRHIGIYKSTYVSTDELMEKLPELLKQEGISVGEGGNFNLAVSLVALDRIGAVVLFTNTQSLIERVNFWAKQIDQAPSGDQLQYFIYQPQFSRAIDLGESLQVLISGGSGIKQAVGNITSATSQNNLTSKENSQRNMLSISASNKDVSLVVDARANSLIFNTSGDKYRQLLPLIKQLDVMPKQVMLEMMIAEVTLTDEFQQGLSFALTNMGIASETGGFNLTSGAAGLSYELSGAQGSLTLNLLQTNSHVNVLSRPSLLVRDGVTANITVGDDIPTVGSIITDPVNGSQASIVYRKTGVELEVTPTINARGVVIMEINQKISNQASGGSSVEGAPIIFERSISTEVVAESGETIVLGGLISENRTINDTSVPFFSKIPILGALFDSSGDSTGKTELVVLVTPRIIEATHEWNDIKAKLSALFSELALE